MATPTKTGTELAELPRMLAEELQAICPELRQHRVATEFRIRRAMLEFAERAAQDLCEWCDLSADQTKIENGGVAQAEKFDGKWTHIITWADGHKSRFGCNAQAIRELAEGLKK